MLDTRATKEIALVSAAQRVPHSAFTRLVDQVDVAYSYRIDSAYSVEAGGAASLTAIVGDANGWQKSIELVPPTTFLGRETTVRGALDLARIQRLLARLERDTGVAPIAVTLTIEPRVVVEGRVDGVAIADSHESRFTFAVEQDRVTVAPSSDGTRAGSLSHVEPQPLSRATPSELSILGQPLSVPAARRASVAVLAGSLLAIGLLLLLRARQRPRSEHDRIVGRHGYAIVPVATNEQAEGRRVVDLPSIQDLLRLAENHGALVLHETEAGECFWFELGLTTFRYAPEPSAEAHLSEPKPGPAALAPKASLVAGTR